MHSLDEDILEAICALPPGAAWLFTVVATWGSSPRPPGSLLLIDSQGRRTGSVSGGCLEEALAERIDAGALRGPEPTLLTFGDIPGESARLGLPCGGRLELLAEPIGDLAPWQRLREQVARRQVLDRRVCLISGETSLHPDPDMPGFRYVPGVSLVRTFGPAWQLLIVGAGPIARYLAPIAQGLGYRVVVCDPREDARAAWEPSAIALDPSMPDEAAAARADDPRTALVALTHDPRLDDMALMEALTGRAFYVGALGSRRTQAARRTRLAVLGLSEEQIGRLHGPVGLDLGARTPPEIAVAIAADLILARRAPERA